jgi:hypothetical protein
MARLTAFLILGGYTVSWFAFERQTLDWHGTATLITRAMTLLMPAGET